MENRRIKLFFKTTWVAIILIFIVGIAGYIITGNTADLGPWLYCASYVAIQFAIISLIIYIVIKAKEWVENYLDALTEKPNDVSDLRETITQLRISVDAIGKKVDNIEKILENVPYAIG